VYVCVHVGTHEGVCIHKGPPCTEIHHYHMYYSKGSLFRRFEIITTNSLSNDYMDLSWTWDSGLKMFLTMS